MFDFRAGVGYFDSVMPRSKVVIVRGAGSAAADGTVDGAVLGRLFEKGLRLLTGQPSAAAALGSLFKASDRVGIKINTIAGRRLTTPPEAALPLARLLVQAGLPERQIHIWDRTSREMREAGYALNIAGAAFRILGTDARGLGYKPDPIEHRSIGSRVSAVQADLVSASISFAVLKDHGLAGVTAGMKNYFGAIHNPNKYHDDNCDPAVADLFDAPPVKSKHRLTVLDARIVQFHRGPSFHSAWAQRSETLVFSLDPVAADWAGWQMIEKLRRAKGLPSLEEDGRPPRYIRTAADLGLGRAGAEAVEIVEDAV